MNTRRIWTSIIVSKLRGMPKMIKRKRRRKLRLSRGLRRSKHGVWNTQS